MPVSPLTGTPETGMATLPADTVQGVVMAFNPLKGEFEPVAGARVSVAGAPSVATTTAEGAYTLTGLKPGRHTLQVFAEGYTDGQAQIQTNRVCGLHHVNVAVLREGLGAAAGRLDDAVAPRRGFELQQTVTSTPVATAPAARNVTVVGVVADPRGCAVIGPVNSPARINVTASNGTIAQASGNGVLLSNGGTGAASTITTTTGFYAFNVNGAVGKLDLRGTASGKTRGGIALERRESVNASTSSDTATSVIMSIQMDSFESITAPTVVGSLVPGGLCTLNFGQGLSSRADEIFIRLRSQADPSLVWEVLPESVTSNFGVGSVVIRIPYAIQTGTFTLQAVQLGIGGSDWSAPRAVDPYTLSDFNASVLDGSVSYDDVISRAGVNYGLLEVDDEVLYTLPLRNTHPSVAAQVTVALDIATGVVVASASFDGVTISPTPTPVGRRLTIANLNLPAGTSTPKPLALRLRRTSGLLEGQVCDITNVVLSEPFFNMQRPLTAAERTGAQAFTANDFSSSTWTISQTVLDDGTASNGIGIARIFVTPPASSTVRPLGALRIICVTDTDQTGPGNPQIQGNTTASTTTGTLPNTQASRTLRLVVDGTTFPVFGIFSNFTATDIQDAVDTALGDNAGNRRVTVSKGSAWTFTRNASTASATIGIVGYNASNPSAGSGLNLLNALAIASSGIPSTSLQSTVEANLGAAQVFAPAALGQPSWSLRPLSANHTFTFGLTNYLFTPSTPSMHFPDKGEVFGINGSVGFVFELLPPAQVNATQNPYPGALRSQTIRIDVPIRRTNGQPFKLGGAGQSFIQLRELSLIEGTGAPRFPNFEIPVAPPPSPDPPGALAESSAL
ncbi:MAG: carboxypeptidase-like regulatory domain-containing protein [Candidatus Sericytochromatia bacterium]|nr:carboxypeptidase-like regulatory domain-containing protein [Candidatus Sericytochromatia bacterium]